MDVAILAEYNPFSPGHAWQLQEIRKSLGGKTRIGVFMTQYLTQRGDVALLTPKARAAQALVSGADVVFGLPNQATLVAAPDFACYFWETVVNLEFFDYVAFSAECPDPVFFDRLSTQIVEEEDRYEAYLQEALTVHGYFLAARLEAYKRLYGSPAPELILQKPNNILALEYFLARKRLEKAFITREESLESHKLPQILLLPRQGQGEGAKILLEGADDMKEGGNEIPKGGNVLQDLPSASQIRKLCVHFAQPGLPPLDFASLIPRLAPGYPVEAFAILCYALAQQRQLPTLDALGPFLFPSLELKARALYPDFLEDPVLARLARAKISDFATVSDLVGNLASKSLPQTRVRRTLLGLALGLLTEPGSEKGGARGPAPYLRLLGASQEGRHMLHRLKSLGSPKKPIIAGSAGRFLDASDKRFQAVARKDYEMSQMVRRAIGLSPDEFFKPPLFLKRARRKGLLSNPDLAALLI